MKWTSKKITHRLRRPDGSEASSAASNCTEDRVMAVVIEAQGRTWTSIAVFYAAQKALSEKHAKVLAGTDSMGARQSRPPAIGSANARLA